MIFRIIAAGSECSQIASYSVIAIVLLPLGIKFAERLLIMKVSHLIGSM